MSDYTAENGWEDFEYTFYLGDEELRYYATIKLVGDGSDDFYVEEEDFDLHITSKALGYKIISYVTCEAPDSIVDEVFNKYTIDNPELDSAILKQLLESKEVGTGIGEEP